jgi:hypothetical protein
LGNATIDTLQAELAEIPKLRAALVEAETERDALRTALDAVRDAQRFAGDWLEVEAIEYGVHAQEGDRVPLGKRPAHVRRSAISAVLRTSVSMLSGKDPEAPVVLMLDGGGVVVAALAESERLALMESLTKGKP